MVVVSLDCRIIFFDIRAGVEVGIVEGRRDFVFGRKFLDKIIVKLMVFLK